MKVRAGFSSAEDDPEKLVTPGIVFCSGTVENARGFSVAAGWWHWSFRVSCVWIQKPPLEQSENGKD